LRRMNSHKPVKQLAGKKRKQPQKKKGKKPRVEKEEEAPSTAAIAYNLNSVLILATRGIQQRERHLLNDLRT